MPQLIDKLVSFEPAGHDNALAIKHTQELPEDWLSRLKRKVDPTVTASGEYEKLFVIPVIVIEQWQKAGFDPYNASNKEIANRLRAEGLDAFIVGRI